MTDFIKFFIEEMGKGVIELTWAGMVNILKYISGVQGVDVAVRPCSLALIPDELNMQKMCTKSVEDHPEPLGYIPDCLKTQEMCSSAVRRESDSLKFVPDHFKTQKMCDKVVRDGTPIFLEHVPDWFITKNRLKIKGEH